MTGVLVKQDFPKQICKKHSLRQAEIVGDKALKSLYALKEILKDGKNLGVPEFFGRNIFYRFGRRAKIETVKEQIRQVKQNLENFQKELKNVQVSLDLRMEIGSFLSFADFFFDEPISDYLVYSRLQSTREDVEDGIQLTEELIEKLRKEEEK